MKLTTEGTEDHRGLFGQQREPLNIPRQMMDCIRCRQDHGASRGERQADQSVAGDFEIGAAVWSELYDSPLARERGCDIEISVNVESQALRPAQAFVKRAHVAFGIDFMDTVETGSGGSGYEQVAAGAEGQVISGDAGLECGEDEDLLVTSDFEDRSTAVAHVEILFAIKGDARGDSHTLGVSGHGAVGSDAVDGAVVARGDIHLSLAVEGYGGRIHHLGHEGLDRVVRIDLENRDGNFLPARAGERCVDVAFGVESGIGDRVKTIGDRHGNSYGLGVADVTVGGHDDGA